MVNVPPVVIVFSSVLERPRPDPPVPSVIDEPVLASAALGLGLGLALHYGYRFLMNKDGLGFGDVKFLLVAGVWLADPLLWPPFLFVSGVWGIVTALVWRVLGKGPRFPFGPALAAALLLSLLVPVRELFYWTMRAIYA